MKKRMTLCVMNVIKLKLKRVQCMILSKNEAEQLVAAVTQDIADGVKPFDLQAKVLEEELSVINAKIRAILELPVTSSSTAAYNKALEERVSKREEMA